MLDSAYRRLADLRLALGCTVVAFFLYFRLAAGLATIPAGAPGILALQLAFSRERFLAVLAAWGPDAAGFYVTGMWLDYLYPAAYALALAGWIARLGRDRTGAPGAWGRFLFRLPLAAGLLDWLENSLHLVVLMLPAVPGAGALVWAASLAAALKWSLAGISLLAVLGLAARRLAAAVIRRRPE